MSATLTSSMARISEPRGMLRRFLGLDAIVTGATASRTSRSLDGATNWSHPSGKIVNGWQLTTTERHRCS
ncbi:hypothetical protein T261_8331 [Streptomyces lydicus]|nr:hypothetical protein T261_8331 [Streptomyces lydicus]